MNRPAISLAREVVFDEANHAYTVATTGQRLTPVTELIKGYFPQFDAPRMAERCARGNNPKYRGKSAAEILLEWEQNSQRAREEGNLVHTDIAAFLNGETGSEDHRSPMFPGWLKWWREGLLEPIEAEALLYDTQLGIAGQADLVGWCPQSKSIVIADWKTTKQISGENRYGDRGFGPLSHLPKANLVEYSLQVSMYALLFERMTGLPPKSALIVNLRNGVSTHPVKILRREAETVFSAAGI